RRVAVSRTGRRPPTRWPHARGHSWVPHHRQSVGRRVSFHVGAHAVDPGDEMTVEHLVNGTGRDEVTRLEDGEPVTVRRGQVEVVQRRDDRHPESPDGAHQLQLVPEVEMVRGFVEQEYRRLLRERAGELNTLTLPARERLPASPGQVLHVR